MSKEGSRKTNLDYFQYTDINEVIPQVDILYMTRIQKERFSDPIEYEKVRNAYILRNEMLQGAKKNMRVSASPSQG